MRERLVMPLAADHAVSHHVLGHELGHSFQFDIGLRKSGFQLDAIPLWMTEGMADYYSLGSEDIQKAMYMRDAVFNDNLPYFDEMANQAEYNPYRFGHTMMAFIGGSYGDRAGTDLFKAAGILGVPMAMDSVLNALPEALF